MPASRSRPPRATVVLVHRGGDWIRGSERCVLDLLPALPDMGFRPVVVATAPTLVREATRAGATAYQIDEWAQAMIVPRPIRRRLAEILDAEGAGLVHANMTATIPAVLPAARRRRIPLVAHLHLPLHDDYWRLRELIHQSTVAVGVAAHLLDELRADGMPEDRLVVIENAVNGERLAAGDARGLRDALGIPAGAFVLASVGSLIGRKAPDVTIRGVAASRAAGVDVHVLLVGDGPQAAEYRELARALGVAPSVHFLGERDDVGAVLRDAADAYVASAREEALPLNVLEAQWVGLPVIASDIPGHREPLAEGEAGVIVPVGDADALATAIVHLAGDPGRRATLAARGQELVRARRALRRYQDAFGGLYERLLARPRREYGWLGATRWPEAYTRWAVRAARSRLGLGAPPAGGLM